MERLLKNRLPSGGFNASPERSRAMAAVRGKGNKSTELRLQMAMVRAGLAGWKRQYRSLPGKPDFFFPDAKLAVFVDGCFWHGCERCGHIPKKNNSFWSEKLRRNRERHVLVGRSLRQLGIKPLRIWEHELRHDVEKVIRRIRRAVK